MAERDVTVFLAAQPHGEVPAPELYRRYQAWAEASGQRTMTARAFGLRATAEGARRAHRRTGDVYVFPEVAPAPAGDAGAGYAGAAGWPCFARWR